MSQSEVEILRQALEDIADPIDAWVRRLPEGASIDGVAAIYMSQNPETYRRMAREALRDHYARTGTSAIERKD